MYLSVTLCAIVIYLPTKVKSVTPDICFQKFRSDDCGQAPQPVMYYWKPGSRCEVGFWRGCVPNVNMFKDENECVSTCIFARRARPIDYHSYNALEYEESDDETITTTKTNSNGTTHGDLTTDDQSNSTHNSDSTNDKVHTDNTGGSHPAPTGSGTDTTGAR